MPESFDVIVVGVGSMGSAACYHLAAAGRRVLGLEQFDIAHNRGSHHGQSRMTRTAYFERPEYVPLLKRANQLWRELETESGRSLLHQVGGIFLGPPERELINHSRLAAELHRLDHEILTPAEVRRRWPAFEIPDDWSGFFDPAAGFLRPEECVTAYAECARRRGAILREREPVRRWHTDMKGVAVETDRGRYTADRLIFTAGAWTSQLLADLGVPLRVTRQVMGWVTPPDPVPFAQGRFPVWAIDALDAGDIYYGFPILTGDTAMKLAHHHVGAAFEPDTPSRETNPSDESDFRPALRYLPTADGLLKKMCVCLYTNSPDGDFILDRHPHHDNVEFAAGFSGHGFKFASVIGQLLADRTAVDFLTLSRLIR